MADPTITSVTTWNSEATPAAATTPKKIFHVSTDPNLARQIQQAMVVPAKSDKSSVKAARPTDTAAAAPAKSNTMLYAGLAAVAVLGLLYVASKPKKRK